MGPVSLYLRKSCAEESWHLPSPELMAVNPESIPRRAKVETITRSLSARHSHARWALGGERIRAFLFIVSAECALPTNASLFDFFARILANAPHPYESLRTCFVCATHAHSHFCPQHWLLCHLGLYYSQFRVIRVGDFGLNPCSLSQSLIFLLGTLVLLVAFNREMH